MIGFLLFSLTFFVEIVNLFESSAGSPEGKFNYSGNFYFYQSLILLFGSILFLFLSFYFIKKRRKFMFFGLVFPFFLFLFFTGSCLFG